MIRQAEAERLAIAEWDRWDGDKQGVMAPLTFYMHLQNRRPDILNFRHKGDPYQTVKCWLIEASRYDGT